MPTTVNLATLDPPVVYPQSADVLLCTLTWTHDIADSDTCEMDVRELIGGAEVGTLTTKAGCFVLEPGAKKTHVWLKERVTRTWYKAADDVTDDTRVRTLKGTLLQRDAAGNSRPLSGELDIVFRLSLSYTRGS